MMTTTESSMPIPEAAQAVFGEHVDQARKFAGMLREVGVVRGLIGPRELDRLWERHLLNSAVLTELLTPDCHLVDVGSGAGLPGIPLAIIRPDITLTLVEPMARRVAWLREVITELALSVEVVRGRAEEDPVRERLSGQDIAVARAVAPLERLAGWCLPLLRPGGELLAIKGASAEEELARDAEAIRAVGGGQAKVVSCGDSILETPTTVVKVTRAASTGQRAAPSRRRGKRRTRKDH
jgi:16S rRNA (guanine527-N7)-methyltransferase